MFLLLRKLYFSILIVFMLVCAMDYYFTIHIQIQRKQIYTTINFGIADSKETETTVQQSKRIVTQFDCNGFFLGNRTAIEKAEREMSLHPRSFMSDKMLQNFAHNCSALKSRGYVSHGMTDEELSFPIAFSILLHKEAVQAEMLLRVIYRPHNLYCIHVDAKATSDTYLAMKAVAACFSNVFLVEKRETVVYASFSRLQAEFNCMAESYQRNSSWKYYINYASTMFPLKTNLELVKILKIYNGANDINGVPPLPKRYTVSYKYYFFKNKLRLGRTNVTKSPPPRGLNITKGSIYGVFSRAFVNFLLTDPLAQELIEWSKDTFSPDEHVAATLHNVDRNRFLETPGGDTGPIKDKQYYAAYVKWDLRKDSCPTNYTLHSICINGLRTLSHLLTRKELSVNKFKLGFQYLAWDCMEEWYFNRTHSPPRDMGLEYYKRAPFVLHHL